MSALNRKALRDLYQLRSQAIAIALVIGAGVGVLIMALSTLETIRNSKAVFYDRYGFADVFVEMKSAHRSLVGRVTEVPGVARAEGRIVRDVTLDVENMDEPAIGRLISIPDGARPRLNGIHLRRGRWPAPFHRNEVLVGEPFADAHDLHPGDKVVAIVNARRQELEIVGIALSPEYLIQIGPGSMMPDDRLFAVFYIGYEGLAAAMDMDGAINSITLKLMRGALEPEVIRQLDRLTEDYGGTGAYGRDKQVSDQYISDEIRQLRTMSTIAPTIFLGVATFLLNIVLTRLINTQREQIAALKAFGYSRWEIATHYLSMVMAIPLLGVAVGLVAGLYQGQSMARMYARFYRFPVFSFQLDPRVLLIALAIAVVAALLGTLAAIRRAVVIAPAEAMRPEPPATYRRTLVDRMGLNAWLPHAFRMVVRNLQRRPIKSVISVIGIAMSVAVLVLGGFTLDALNYLMDVQFRLSQQHDVAVTTINPSEHRVIHEMQNLSGVQRCQPFRTVPVRLRVGHREERTAITGLENHGLMRLIDRGEREVLLPDEGLVLAETLANKLKVAPGEAVTVEMLDGERDVRQVHVTGLVAEFGGLNAYMQLAALRRLLEEGDTANGAYLMVDPLLQTSLYRELKSVPHVAAVNIKSALLDSFEKTIAENMLQMRLMNILFATVIAFGVVYNTARISLSERNRELSTLRVIGFSRREVSDILLGELALLTLAAIPPGMLIGYGLAAYMTMHLQTDIYRIPLVIEKPTYAFAVVVVVAAAAISALVVRRRIDRLDLVAVLKSKE